MADVVSGDTRVVARLKDFRRKHSNGLVRGLKKGGTLLKKNTLPFIPKDDKDLSKTLKVTTKTEGGKPVVEVSVDSPYAGPVHDRPPSKVAHGAQYNIEHAEDIAKKKMYWYKGRMKRFHRRGAFESFQFLKIGWNGSIAAIRQMIVDEVRK